MMCFLVFGTLLIAFASAGTPHEYWTLLPTTEAGKMNQPCSRPFPAGLVGSWEPSEADIERAEAKLSGAIKAAFLLLRPEDRRQSPDRYYRQYAGFLRDGKRVLYVNAVSIDDVERPPGNSMSHEWRQRIVNICDGGSVSFGAVYDLDKDAIDSFFFNGTVAGRLPGGGW